MPKKMYVLVRDDLSEQYRFVQGGHALAQYSLDHPAAFAAWGNSTLVYLNAGSLRGLRLWASRLAGDRLHSIFRESDLDGQETALACWDDGAIFKNLDVA